MLSKRRAAWVGLVVGFGTVTGCADHEQTVDRCPSAPLLTMADASEATDYRIDFDTENSSGVFTPSDDANNAVAYRLNAGRVAFRTDDPNCMASPDHPCSIELRQLNLEFGALTLPTSAGSVNVYSLAISAEVPVKLVDIGMGFGLDPSALLRFNAAVGDHSEAQTIPVGTAVVLLIDMQWQLLGVNGWVPFDVHLTQNQTCSAGSSVLTFHASGVNPWVLPPGR